MKMPKFKIIEGGRDRLEANLVKSLFGTDDLEIEKQIALINSIAVKKPQLKLINTSEIENIDS